MSTNTLFFVSESSSSNPAVMQSIRQVVSILGLQEVDRIERAQIVFTDNASASLHALKMGCNVIDANFSAGAEPWVGLQATYGKRYFAIPAVGQFLASVTQALALFPVVNLDDYGPLQTPLCKRAEISEKRILIVDDLRVNRRSASAQLAGAQQLVVESSYISALESLHRGDRYDLVMTDLQMPTEGFQIGRKAPQLLGTPIAAGLYIALAAIAADVPDIVVVSYGSHHDDGIIAAMDLLQSFNKGDSFVSYLNVNQSIGGGKDWAGAYEAHLKKHLLE